MLGVPVLAVDTDTDDTAAAVGRVRAAIGRDDDRKVAAAIRLFEDGVDHTAIREWLDVAQPRGVTPLMFEQRLLERARTDVKHVVLPEGDDDRVLRAAEQLLLRGVGELTVLGREDDVTARARALGAGQDHESADDGAAVALRWAQHSAVRVAAAKSCPSSTPG